MSTEGLGITSFACALGDLECKPDDIGDFAELWHAESGGSDFATMGCGTFRKMSGPVEAYLVESVRRTLDDRDVPARDVDRIVFATTDACLGFVGRDFVAQILDAVGLSRCVPVVVSFQQCCSSITALSYGWNLFADPAVSSVVVVAFDFTARDSDRVRSFALFGDAVASCLITRNDASGLRVVSSAVRVDYDGLLGRDSMVSRQQVAQQTLDAVLDAPGVSLSGVTRVFPTNLYAPLTSFNAAVAGVHKSKLHFIDTLYAYGHCGNCDWMLNLIDYRDGVGLRPGEAYVAQASAPGFFACCLLLGG